MHEVNHTPPNRMTPKQRRDEVASLLAKGLVRLRMDRSPPPARCATESEISLGFSGDKSVHSDTVYNQHTES